MPNTASQTLPGNANVVYGIIHNEQVHARLFGNIPVEMKPARTVGFTRRCLHEAGVDQIRQG